MWKLKSKTNGKFRSDGDSFHHRRARLWAPAYDLTHCAEGYNGEHATSVNNSAHPSIEDMVAVGVKNKMQEQKCREIYYEVEDIIKRGM